jgi:signal transduction histidine kinase
MILVALAFQPLRRSVVRLADRIAYGARAAPYEALADFSRRLGGSPAFETLLPAVAEATATAVLAEHVTVRLAVPDGPDRLAHWPSGRTRPSTGSVVTEFGVVDRGERLGIIEVAMPPGRSLRAGDHALLADLADQAALAFRNNRLAEQLADRVAMLDQQTAQLAESRARIIAARDGERDRLERAIRAGVAPHLEPTPRRLQRMTADVDAPGVERDLAAVLSDSVTALENLREITRGIMPPQLVRSGLAAAVSAHLGQAGHAGALAMDESVAGRRFDRTVESTAYFGLVEALRQLRPPIQVTLTAIGDLLTLTVGGSGRHPPTIDTLCGRLEPLGGTVQCRREGDRAVLAMRIPAEPVPIAN